MTKSSGLFCSFWDLDFLTFTKSTITRPKITFRQHVKVPTYSTNRGLSKNAIKKVVIPIGSKDLVFAKSLWRTGQVYSTILFTFFCTWTAPQRAHVAAQPTGFSLRFLRLLNNTDNIEVEGIGGHYLCRAACHLTVEHAAIATRCRSNFEKLWHYVRSHFSNLCDSYDKIHQ